MGKARRRDYNYRVGDLFALRVGPAEFAFGRVLLDLYRQCVKPRRVEAASTLSFGNRHTVLIELFAETSAVTSTAERIDVEGAKRLVPGLFTSNVDLLLGYWEVVGHHPVDPRQVDFPESLSHEGAFSGRFVKGEVRISIEIPYEEVEVIGVYRTELSSAEVPEVFLHAAGRSGEQALPPDKRSLRDLARHDLRRSPHRQRVYDLLPDDAKLPYDEMARARGYDLGRFYDGPFFAGPDRSTMVAPQLPPPWSPRR